MRPGPIDKGIAKRTEILRAALYVFDRDGQSSTLRTIAKASGLSVAGLMHYFESRDHLFTEVLRDFDEPAVDDFERLGDSADPGELLAQAMAADAVTPVKIKLYITMLAASTAPGHPAAEYFRSRFEYVRREIAALVRRRQELGLTSSLVDPEFVASCLIAEADGIQNQWLHDPTIDMAAHIRKVWRLLVPTLDESA